MSELDGPQTELLVEADDLSEQIDTAGLERLELDSFLGEEELRLLRDQLFERSIGLLEDHPDARITSSEYSPVLTGELTLNRSYGEALFTQFHLEPYTQITLRIGEGDDAPTVTLEAVQPNGSCHSIGIGTTQELEIETMDMTSGETIDHRPMVADAMFMQDILGAFESTLPKAEAG